MYPASHLQPEAYRNDLTSFYYSLFYPSPSQVGSFSQRNFFEPLSSSAVPLSQLGQQQPHYMLSQSFPTMSLYDYLYSPRLGKREVRSSVTTSSSQQKQDGKFDYETDYDESKFLKIRLSLGPISIYRPFIEKEEVVSCSLNLIDLDTLVSEYENKIFETINVEEYLEQPSEDDDDDDDDENVIEYSILSSKSW